MNRGRLSFFLDGMKYGEHNLADLGEAFDGLTSCGRIRPLTLYPIVGLQKSQDRVAITPRWLSSPGTTALQDLNAADAIWSLILDINTESSLTAPTLRREWFIDKSYRDWCVWRAGESLVIKTRCNPLTSVHLDCSIFACVEASIKLGLSRAWLAGDRIVFSKSCGRHLESPEDAIVLGCYRGNLWYRIQGENVSEGSSLPWFLAEYDIEGCTLLRPKSEAESTLTGPTTPLLPRIPAFAGGILKVICKEGAMMRNGLEIDTAEVLCTIEHGAVVFAIERRVNSSNIVRYRVIHNGLIGWISERMRGGSEDVMLKRVDDYIDASSFMDTAKAAILEIDPSCIVTRQEARDLSEAMELWKSSAEAMGGDLMSSFHQAPPAMEDYLSILRREPLDGWSLEKDYLLSECIQKCASKDGQIPANGSYSALRKSLMEAHYTALFGNADVDFILARAAIIRTFNDHIAPVLPFLGLIDPMESLRHDIFGYSFTVKVEHSMKSPPEPEPYDFGRYSGARRLQDIRRLLFTHTKRSLLESVMDATTTYTPMMVDEYEVIDPSLLSFVFIQLKLSCFSQDPREIKLIKINRVKATLSQLALIPSPSERLKQTVLGQLHKELRGWPGSSYRRSYVCKGHGGQRRAFKVHYFDLLVGVYI